MNGAQVWAVAGKELVDGMRDRRSVIAALAYSLFGPLVLALALAGLAARTDAERPVNAVIVGGDRAPALVRWLEDAGLGSGGGELSPEEAVREGAIDLAVTIPEGWVRDTARGHQVAVELLFDGSRGASASAARRVGGWIAAWGESVADARLVERGVSPAVASPVRVDAVDLEPRTARDIAASILPVFLVMGTFLGGMGLAIDVVAGERERGSLDLLLLQPVTPLELATGKWLAAASLGVLGTLLTLGAAMTALGREALRPLGLGLGLVTAETLRLALLLLPLALAVPALQMLVSLTARSFREAQTYLSLLLLAPALPGFLFAFDAARPEPWMQLAPLLAQQIQLAEVLAGSEPGAPLWPAGLTTFFLAVLCVLATARLLRSERMLAGPG